MAVWNGELKAGKGALSTESGAIREQPYTFATRFESSAGTNPEEVIAAAHAACFSMAFAAELEKAGFVPETIETTATLSFDKTDAGWGTSGIHLQTRGRVPGADHGAFQKAAEAAKAGCPVSRLLKAPITLTAELAGGAEKAA